MQGNFRKNLVRLVTFLGGLYFFAEFVLPEFILTKLGYTPKLHELISQGFIVVSSMAVGLGLINLFVVHGSKIAFRRKDYPYSAVLLIGLLTMMSITIGNWLANLNVNKQVAQVSMLSDFAKRIKDDFESSKEGVPSFFIRNDKLKLATATELDGLVLKVEEIDSELSGNTDRRAELVKIDIDKLLVLAKESRAMLPLLLVAEDVEPDFALNIKLSNALADISVLWTKILRYKQSQTVLSYLYDFLYNGLFVALGSAMFSLLGVYIASAAYRAFRIKSFESTLMMLAAVVVMLGQIPFGIWLYEDLPALRRWLLAVPNSAVFRAIVIGASLAGLVMAFRMWFSIESETFSDKEEG